MWFHSCASIDKVDEATDLLARSPWAILVVEASQADDVDLGLAVVRRAITKARFATIFVSEGLSDESTCMGFAQGLCPV